MAIPYRLVDSSSRQVHTSDDMEIESFIGNIERGKIVKYFLSIGFNSISLDLEGLISGKLNRAIKFSK